MSHPPWSGGPFSRFILAKIDSDGSEVDSCHSCEELEQEWEKAGDSMGVGEGLAFFDCKASVLSCLGVCLSYSPFLLSSALNLI